jgi:hypothetical protein
MYILLRTFVLLAIAGSSLAAPTGPGIDQPIQAVELAARNGDYMTIVNLWRVRLGLPILSKSDTLVSNAQKTVNDGHGKMVHELNRGSMAQVLAPGSANNFEHVFVGGWLCEKPNMPGMNGICKTESSGWAYNSQTGHADILSSRSYTKIGCAIASGIWGCDLA